MNEESSRFDKFKALSPPKGKAGKEGGRNWLSVRFWVFFDFTRTANADGNAAVEEKR